LQAFQANRFQVLWRSRIDQSWRDWLVMQNLIQRMRDRFPLEGRMAGQQMVESRSQSINITSETDLALARGRLLWRHITGRTQWLAGNGEARISFDSPRQAEIRHTRHVVSADKDVRGL
jgi:hypothetical protein